MSGIVVDLHNTNKGTTDGKWRKGMCLTRCHREHNPVAQFDAPRHATSGIPQRLKTRLGYTVTLHGYGNTCHRKVLPTKRCVVRQRPYMCTLLQRNPERHQSLAPSSQPHTQGISHDHSP